MQGSHRKIVSKFQDFPGLFFHFSRIFQIFFQDFSRTYRFLRANSRIFQVLFLNNKRFYKNNTKLKFGQNTGCPQKMITLLLNFSIDILKSNTCATMPYGI